MKEIKVFETQDLANSFLINFIKKLSNTEIKKKGYCTIALSGGKTPLLLYEGLSQEKDILWDKIHIFFVDERMVPNDDEKSNIFQINKSLFKPLNLKKENTHYISKDIDVDDAAKEYALEIKSFFKEEIPSFDLILLGIGEDGHTASLFANSKNLQEKEKLIVVEQKKNEDFERLSFTFPLINHAKNIAFLEFGENKANIIKKLLLDKDYKLPAYHVKPKEKLCFLLDKKAAKFIDL